MPTFELPYHRATVPVELPDGLSVDVLRAASTPSRPLPQLFDEAWRSPIGIDDPAELFRPGDRVIFLVTDHTRATPTRELFPLVWERIADRVAIDDVTLLVATGTHRAPTETELESLLGKLRKRFRVEIHDCDGDVVEVGVSRAGTPIEIHRSAVDADRVVSLGHIGMHYYAGYTGGRKNVLPGIAGRATIERNHARLTEPQSRACLYRGNPISEEMVEAAAMVGLDLIVDVVLASDGTVAKVVVGDPEPAHAAGRAFWDEQFQVPFDVPYDLVIASPGGHPKDIDLYQAYKGQYNAMQALRKNGVLCLLAACSDGIGHPVFAEWMESSAGPEEVLHRYEQEGFVLGGHKAVFLARDLQRAAIHLQSELDPETVRRYFLEPVFDTGAAMAAARRRFGDAVRVLVMPHAGDTFPVRDGGVAHR